VAFACALVAAGPNWAEKLTAIFTILASLGFIAAAVAAWVAVTQLRETRRDRHIQVISDFGLRWDSPPLNEAREQLRRFDNIDLCEKVAARRRKPVSQNPLRFRAWQRERNAAEVLLLLRVPNYFEDLGLMVDCGALDIELVGKAIGELALAEWGRWELAITLIRAEAPLAYSKFGKLVEQLRELELD
jgi:hypothetical protein